MNRRQWLIASSSTLAAGLGLTARASEPLTVGVVSLSFYGVAGAVVTAVLERLGHRVVIREGSHEEMFPLLGNGTLDLMVAVWLPEGHAAYWERHGKSAVELTRLYDGARFFWAVPSYVPEEEVASIADLANPKVAGRMQRVVQGIGQGATISTLSQRAIGNYGLDALGYTFRPGTQAQWLSALRDAVARQHWVVVPMWTPLFLNQDQSLRPLHDPQGTFGATNRAAVVGPRLRVESLPAATRQTLARLTLDLEAVTQMDWDVNVRNLTPAEAARGWMSANAERVESWFRTVRR